MQVSVVIPTYNSASFIKETLESVVAAARDLVYEIIIVDDFSKDIKELKEIVDSYACARIIEKDKKSNASVSRNIGIKASQGDYIFLLDSDDHFIEGYLEKRITFMDQQKCDLAFGAYFNVWGDARHPVIEPPASQNAKDYLFKEHKDVRTSTISFKSNRKNDFLFNEKLNKHQDWGFLIENTEKNCQWSYDSEPGVELYVARDERMSGTMNLEASDVFISTYLDNKEYITGFCSRLFWLSIITDDKKSYHFYSDKMDLAYLDRRAKFAKIAGDIAYRINIFNLYHIMMCQVREYLINRGLSKKQ